MASARPVPFIVAFALALPASILGAADISGTWIGTMPRRDRAPARAIAFRFVQDGRAVSGKAYNDAGASDPILAGHVSASEIRFDVEVTEQAGNQINLVIYRFTGTVDEDGIDVTRERVSARDAVSGDAIPVRRPSDTDEEDRARRFRSLHLERLFR